MEIDRISRNEIFVSALSKNIKKRNIFDICFVTSFTPSAANKGQTRSLTTTHDITK